MKRASCNQGFRRGWAYFFGLLSLVITPSPSGQAVALSSPGQEPPAAGSLTSQPADLEQLGQKPRGLIDPRRSLPELTTVPSDVRDQAKLFSAEAIQSAREALAKIEKSIGAPVLIDTVESLDGDPVDEVAARRAKRSGTQGVYVLIAKKESKLEVLPSVRYLPALPREARNRVREAFVERFRGRHFDDGLQSGIAVITEELANAKKAGKLPQAEAAGFGDELRARGFLPRAGTSGNAEQRSPSPPSTGGEPSNGAAMVRRDRIHLTLGGARVIIAAAARQAAAMNLKVNIAVVDDGGHLLSFDRMDDARPASGYTAITKATTAATFRQPTGPLPPGATSPDLLLNLSLQLTAQSSGGKITTLFGGVPVVVDDQVIGGVGVGGGTGEQDATVARAGIQALLEALKAEKPAASDSDKK